MCVSNEERIQLLVDSLIDSNKNAQLWFEQAKEKAQENVKLKELLKECVNMFEKMYTTNTVNSVFIPLYENIKSKIDRVLNEKSK